MGLQELLNLFNDSNEQEATKPENEQQEDRELILADSIDRERKAALTYKRMAHNIKKSERLRAKINKSVAAGDPEDKILEDCIKCISLMTGEDLFYKQNIKKLRDRG